MHAPTNFTVQAPRADPGALGRDLELIVRLVSVDTVAQMSRVGGADHRIRSINTFLILFTVVDQDVEWRSGHNLASELLVAGGYASDLQVHAPATAGVCAPGTDFVARGRDVKCIASLVRVDAIAEMACVPGTGDREAVRYTLSVLLAAVNKDVHWRRKASNLQVHAPADIRVCASGAHLIVIVSANFDVESVSCGVSIDTIAYVPRIICADHRHRSRHTLLVAVAVVDEDMDGRPSNRNVPNTELGMRSPKRGAEIFRQYVVVARNTRHEVLLLAAHGMGLMACPAVPLDGTRTKLSEVHRGGDAARPWEMDIRALLSRRLYAAVCTCQAELGIFVEVVLTERVRVGLVHACHASHITHVPTAARMHLEARLMRPGVNHTGLSIVSRPTIPNGTRIVNAGAPLWRRLHAAFLRAGRLDDETVLRILLGMFFAEIFGKDANQTRCTLHRIPGAATDANVVASTIDPLDGVVNISVVGCVSVSDSQRVDDFRATLRWSLHAAVLPSQAHVGALVAMFCTEILRQNACCACRTAQVIREPTAPGMHLKASSRLPREDCADLAVVGGKAITDCPQVVNASTFGRRRRHTALLSIYGWRTAWDSGI